MKTFIGFGVIALVVASIAGVLHLMDWSYSEGKGDCRVRVENSNRVLRNNMTLEWQIKLENALQDKDYEYKNWDYATANCEQVDPIIESNDCFYPDYESMISERDEEIKRLNSLLLNYQYK